MTTWMMPAIRERRAKTWDAGAGKAKAWLNARGLRVEGGHPIDWLRGLIG